MKTATNVQLWLVVIATVACGPEIPDGTPSVRRADGDLQAGPARDLPLYLYTSAGTSVAHRRLRGLSSPRRIDPVAHMDELWVDGP